MLVLSAIVNCKYVTIIYKSSMYNRSRGKRLAVGAEPGHERCLFFGCREGRLERIAREEDALVGGEAALAWSRVR